MIAENKNIIVKCYWFFSFWLGYKNYHYFVRTAPLKKTAAQFCAAALSFSI